MSLTRIIICIIWIYTAKNIYLQLLNTIIFFLNS